MRAWWELLFNDVVEIGMTGMLVHCTAHREEGQITFFGVG